MLKEWHSNLSESVAGIPGGGPATGRLQVGLGSKSRNTPTAAESDTILLFNVPARDSVVFHDEIEAAHPAQILVYVDLIIVVAPAFIHPRNQINVR